MSHASCFTPLAPGQNRILVLCGNEAPAVAAANVYARAFPGKDVRFIEERTVSLRRTLIFSARRLKSKGLFSLLDSYAYYVHHWLRQCLGQCLGHCLPHCLKPSGAPAKPEKAFLPEFTCTAFSRDKRLADFIRSFQPDVIITACCGLLAPQFLHSLTRPVYNTHPGINPRYRGFGNIWAYSDGNPALTGFTVHRVDEGADTGERILVQRLSFDGVPFDNIDEYAYAAAAGQLAALLLGERQPSIPEEFQNLESRYYGVPTLSAYLRARQSFERTQHRMMPMTTAQKNETRPAHILITGASGGLGQAIAAEYAAPGLRFTLLGRDANRLETTRALCKAKGAEARIITLDMRDEAAVRRTARELEAENPADLVFLNAGVSSGTLPDGAQEAAEEACRTMNVNACATINMAAAFLEGMRKRNAGHIVCISSIAAIYPLPDSPAYSASKIAVAWYAKAMRAALHGSGVRLSVVYPGYVVSPMSNRLAGPQPLRWTADKAAKHIRQRLEAGADCIPFPKLLALGAFLLHFLPLAGAAFFLKRFGFTIDPDAEARADAPDSTADIASTPVTPAPPANPASPASPTSPASPDNKDSADV